MPDKGQTFIDLYGTGRRSGGGGPFGMGQGPHPDGPFWKRAILGQEALWKVFWGGFVFGHGFLIAFGIGLTLFSVAIGMALEPRQFSATFVSMMTALSIVGLVAMAFVGWSVISVWRCAVNVLERRWTYAARAIVAAYIGLLSLPIWSFGF
ncbi:MAG: hypothetical protein O2944_10285 [Proteobacteria bacterium]|nr:hypothetical protein [Pseudomonadota bacterium]